MSLFFFFELFLDFLRLLKNKTWVERNLQERNCLRCTLAVLMLCLTDRLSDKTIMFIRTHRVIWRLWNRSSYRKRRRVGKRPESDQKTRRMCLINRKMMWRKVRRTGVHPSRLSTHVRWIDSRKHPDWPLLLIGSDFKGKNLKEMKSLSQTRGKRTHHIQCPSVPGSEWMPVPGQATNSRELSQNFISALYRFLFGSRGNLVLGQGLCSWRDGMTKQGPKIGWTQ